jgi:hypothetical protein
MAKSTVGFVLTLIGGILQILGSIALFGMATLVAAFIPSFLTKLGFVLPVVLLVCGIISIWASTMMNKEDGNKVKNGGIIALIVGILGGLNILVIIGAIVALVQSKS